MRLGRTGHDAMKKKRKTGETSSYGGLASFAVIMLIVAIALWLASRGAGDLSENWAVQPPAPLAVRAQSTPETAQNIKHLTRIKSILPDLSLSVEQLLDYRTIHQVAREMPHREEPPPERIVSLQLGDYPGLLPELETIVGQPLNDALKPYDELSRPEKLLLYADWLGTQYLDQPAYQLLIARMNAAEMAFVKGYDEISLLWQESDRKHLLSIYQNSAEDPDELRRLLRRDWLPRFASPVTLSFFEPWHEKWTAGQGYIEEISDQAERSRLIEALISHQVGEELDGIGALQQTPEQAVGPIKGEPEVPPGAYDFAKFFYFRIYGENPGEIIAEGIRQVNDYQAWQHRWENRPAVKR